MLQVLSLMSKRKRKVRDGEAESSSAQAGKKLKTSHTLSSAGQPTSGDTALAITASSHRDGLVDDNAARKQTRLAKKLAKRLKKQEKKNETNKTLEKVSSPLWKVSEPVGGSLLDLDPIFSPDGQ